MHDAKSASDLVIVPLSGGVPIATERARRDVWKAVVDAPPPIAIDPAAQPILKRLVAQVALRERHAVSLRRLRAEPPG